MGDSLTAGPTPCGKEYDDMLLALNYTMANPSAHSAFATADFSRVGAFGHSMGGSAATRIAEFGASSGVNVVAAVASHGAASVTNIDVPTLFTTGTLDTKDHDDAGNPNHFRHEFDICSSPTKVFVNLKGGYHMEPCEGKRMNFLTEKAGLVCLVVEHALANGADESHRAHGGGKGDNGHNGHNLGLAKQVAADLVEDHGVWWCVCVCGAEVWLEREAEVVLLWLLAVTPH